MNTISTYVDDRLHHHHGQSPWHEAADHLSMTPLPPGERPLDGTATGRVTTKEPPLTGKRVAAVLACIAEWFPQAFVPEEYLPHRPLKIGMIHIDPKACCPALSERERSAVLRYYVARLMYLRACVARRAPHRSASPPAPPRWSPLPLAAHDARQGRRSRRRRGTRSFQHCCPAPRRPCRATATAVVVADPHNHQPERSLPPWAR